MRRARECGAFIIPRFPQASLTTKDFRWLAPEAWNDAHKTRFLTLRQAPVAGLFTAPPYVSGRRRKPPAPAGRWVLEMKRCWSGFSRRIHTAPSS